MQIKLQNHFLKTKIKGTFSSPIYSIVYNGIPNNRLMIKDELIAETLKDVEVREVFSSYKDVSSLINDLVRQGAILEFAGVNLEQRLGL